MARTTKNPPVATAGSGIKGNIGADRSSIGRISRPKKQAAAANGRGTRNKRAPAPTGGEFDWAGHGEAVVAAIFGEPNSQLSRPPEDVRFGNKGSVSVNLTNGVWQDFENNRGGGIKDLISTYADIYDRDEIIAYAEQCQRDFEDGAKPRPNGNAKTSQHHAKEVEATYQYLDASGEVVFEVVRSFLKQGGDYVTDAQGKRIKTFSQRRPQGDATPVVPYQLPDLLKAVAANQTICIAEGEKKVDLIRSFGFPATCCAGGAKKWGPEHSAYLKGADVVLLPDNDEVGREHVQAIADSLFPDARRLRLLELPDLPEKVDVVDWHAAGGSAEEFARLVAAAADYEADESTGPQPLMRPLPPPEPFPLEALGAELAETAQAICDVVQSPVEMCGGAVLASASFAVSAHVNITLPTGQTKPVNNWSWCIAESGERKTATDDEAFAPQKQYEKKLHAEYRKAMEDYGARKTMWEAKSKAIDKQYKKPEEVGSEAHEKEKEQLGAEPEEPLLALIMASDFTFEGLVQCLNCGQPLYGIIGSEGGQFIGGHSFTDEAKLRTITGLSAAWDGEPIRRVRAKETVILYGRRGKRMHKATPPEAARILQQYKDRMLGIMETPYPLAPDTLNELEPRAVPFSAEAAALFWEFADEVEGLMAAGGDYEPIRAFAAKLPEHAARLGATIAAYRDLNFTELGREDYLRGIHIATYYANEAKRISGTGLIGAELSPAQKLAPAQKLLDWLRHDWTNDTITARDIYTHGPRKIRDRETATDLAEILVEHGWLVPVKTRQRNMKEWQIVKGPNQ